MKLPPHQAVYVRSMGKALRVTAIFTEDRAANAYMEKHADEAVIAVFGGVVFLANVHDRGVPLPP